MNTEQKKHVEMHFTNANHVSIQRQMEIQLTNVRNTKEGGRCAEQTCPAITITLAAFWPSVDNVDDDYESVFFN